VRVIAYLGGIAVLSLAAAQFFQSPPAMRAKPVSQPHWIEIERPFPAFAPSIPEAADAPASYVIRRHAAGGGRKDILALGEPDGVAPPLRRQLIRFAANHENSAPPHRRGRFLDDLRQHLPVAAQLHVIGPVAASRSGLDCVAT
jgi:hypothetical protein